MKNRKVLIYFILLIVINSACDDVVEKDISKNLVVMRSPADAYIDTLATGQTFWWDALDGATKYEVLIVSPTFENANTIFLDTTIVKNKFTIQLDKGQYDWCVKGINSGYETQYSCRHIQVDKNYAGQIDITSQIVSLKTPLDGDTLKVTQVQTLGWSTLTGASTYEILVSYVDSFNNVKFMLDSVTTSKQIVVKLPKHNYSWCVKGLNSKYQTKYQCRSLVIVN